MHSGQDDTKLQQAISAGNSVDVGLSYSTDIVGAFCSSGAFRDLTPYIKRDKVDISDLTPVTKSYTEYKGKRCAMPALSDDYALYYNTDLLSRGRHHDAAEDAERARDGCAQADHLQPGRLDQDPGLRPGDGLLRERGRALRAGDGAKWLDSKQKSLIGSDPGWPELIKWQTAFVQKIGYAKLKALRRRGRPGVLRRQRVPEGQDRDEPRRRVAHRVHRRPGPKLKYAHGAVPHRG